MLLETISIAIAAAGLAHASYTDLKTRLIDERVVYALIALGALLHITESFLASDWTILATMLATVAATFIGAYALWRIGFWAGGDVQLFAAIAALVPTLAGFPAISTPFGFSVGLVPAAVFFASVLAMLPVGLAIAVSRLAARADMRQQLAHDIASTVPMSIASGIGFGALAILAQRFALAWPLVLAAGILFVFLPSRIRLVAAIALGISGLALDPFGLLVWSADSAAAVLLIGIAFRIGRTKTLFRSRKKVTDLVEGDVVATDIVEHDGKIELRETDAIQTVINHLKPKDTKTGERVVWSGYQTNGLEESDLATLHALADAKRIPDTLWVKETTPFVPAILAGFALTILFGAWIWKTMGL